MCWERKKGRCVMEKADIFISGGGLAGLIAAIAFGRAGFSVICADPIPPVTLNNEQSGIVLNPIMPHQSGQLTGFEHKNDAI